ncbi:MAG: chorismate mutase [Desulfovibrionaceae bacterium]
MTTEYEDTKPEVNTVRQERLDDLMAVDAQILKLLERRSRILGKEAAWRRTKGMPRIDTNLEKSLWVEWEEAGRKNDLPPRLLRQLFNLVNLFGQDDAKGKRRADAYILAPRLEPVAVEAVAPRSLRLTRLWTMLASAANQQAFLGSIILNDPFIELVKGLNQAGGAVAWSGDDRAEIHPGAGLFFEEKLIFAGDDPLNFYLLLALALAGAGRMKFSGGSGLKMLNVSRLNAVLPRLGARLVPLNPHGDGLPARLECGGEMAQRVDLPEQTSPDFATALVLAAWSYPEGLALGFAQVPEALPALQEAVDVLNAAGIDARIEADVCRVPAGKPVIPVCPPLPPDSLLSAYLLSLPVFADGKVILSGFDAASAAHPALQTLGTLGADLNLDGDKLISSALKMPDKDIDFGAEAGLLPLGVALALRARRELTVVIPENGDLNGATQMLDKLNASYSTMDNALRISPSQLHWEESWASPDPYLCIACALISFQRPGIGLENPGMLTALWPQFWNIFNTLPSGRMKPKAKESTTYDAPKRRRVKIGREPNS